MAMQPTEFQQLLDDIMYEVVTEKGQRILRPKDCQFQEDPIYEQLKKHEVFFGNLPHDLFENELLPFLCRVGPVYQIRLLVNFSGSSKGMAYVIFTQVEHAFDALEQLAGEYIRAGCPKQVRVSFSVNNCRLMLKNLPAATTPDELSKALTVHVNGVSKVKVFTDQVPTTNALVTFASHQLAATARRVFVPEASQVTIFGRKPQVEWAKPKDFKTLFVLFNCSFVNRDTIKDYFENNFDNNIKVKRVTIQGKSAFVKFLSFTHANSVIKKYSQLTDPNLYLNHYLFIQDISWPLRK